MIIALDPETERYHKQDLSAVRHLFSAQSIKK